jgi:hypothetical protein
MKLNRMSLLIVAAVAAVAALAVPASASAAEWLHEGKPFKEHVEMKLAGGEVIEIGEKEKDVMLCESNLTITTEGGSTGQAGYEVKPATCVGLAGRLKECTATEVKTTGTPWALTVNATDLTAKGIKVDYTLNAGCAIKTIEVSAPELTVVPHEEPGSIDLFEWNTAGTGKVNGEASAISYFGSSSFPEAELGTYGIG